MGIQCTTCDLLKRRDADVAPLWDSIYRTEGFDIVHAFGVSLPGWMVLVARRHIAAMDELTVREASELGALLRLVSIGLKEILGCEKTYVMQFAEGDGHHHVHVHLVPRERLIKVYFRHNRVRGVLRNLLTYSMLTNFLRSPLPVCRTTCSDKNILLIRRSLVHPICRLRIEALIYLTICSLRMKSLSQRVIKLALR